MRDDPDIEIHESYLKEIFNIILTKEKEKGNRKHM